MSNHYIGEICVAKLNVYPKYEDVSIKKSFDFSDALENVFPLVDIICTYLNFTDLLTISQISNAWNISAQNEIKKRKQPSWLRLSNNCKVKTCEASKNNNYAEKDKAIIFYDNNLLKLDQFICYHDTEYVRKTFVEHIENDILDNPKTNYVAISLKSQDQKVKPVYTGIFFPKIPNIRIEMFYHKKGGLKNILKENEKFDCLLIYSIKKPLHSLKTLMEDLAEHDNENVRICGGNIWGVKAFNGGYPNYIAARSLFCIGFIKDTTIEAEFNSATVVASENEFAQEIASLKANVIHREHSMIFSMSCYAKEWKDIEEPLIKTHFPNAVLVQIDVNGEIGNSNFSMQNQAKHSKKRRLSLPLHLYHEYCTVLLYITWGKLKKLI